MSITMNCVGTLFTSIHQLKIYSVKIPILRRLLCKLFPWNLTLKLSKLTFKEFVFIAVRGP